MIKILCRSFLLPTLQSNMSLVGIRETQDAIISVELPVLCCFVSAREKIYIYTVAITYCMMGDWKSLSSCAFTNLNLTDCYILICSALFGTFWSSSHFFGPHLFKWLYVMCRFSSLFSLTSCIACSEGLHSGPGKRCESSGSTISLKWSQKSKGKLINKILWEVFSVIFFIVLRDSWCFEGPNKSP